MFSEIEPSLRTLNLISPLVNLYKRHGEQDKLIELYAGCVEGAFPNSGIQDPLGDMLALLESRKGSDRVKWGLWMLKKGDVDRGIKVCPAHLREKYLREDLNKYFDSYSFHKKHPSVEIGKGVEKTIAHFSNKSQRPTR